MELYQKGKQWCFEHEGTEYCYWGKTQAEKGAKKLGLQLNVKVSGVPYSVPAEDINIESQPE